MHRLRVVIPALDEAATLPGLLDDLARQTGVDFETVVVDGGSSDATPAIVRALGIRCLNGPAGRGRQMNIGAADFDGEWLLFLHADCRLTATTQLRDALATLRFAGQETVGHFGLVFALEGRPLDGWLYRYMRAKTRTSRRYSINGDQGCLIRRRYFERLGGYDTRLVFLEDQRLATAISRDGRWQCLPHDLVTSARRFETEGRYRRYGLMALIMAMHIADRPEFFENAPTLYARQSRTGRLTIRPFVRQALASFDQAGSADTAGALWRLAGAIVDEAWQLRLALALALSEVFNPAASDTIGARFTRDAPLLSSSVVFRPVRALARLVLFFGLAIAIFGPVICLRLTAGPDRGASSCKESS